MKHLRYFLLSGLLLFCYMQNVTYAQSTTFQTIPESLRGYWQFETYNVTDWNGPLIGENFVESFYTVFQAEQMEKESDGSYFFHLRNQKGDKMDFRLTPIGKDSAIIFYQGWEEPELCVRKQIPDHTEMLTPTTLPDIIYRKWVKGLSGNVLYEFTRDGKLLYDGKTWNIISAGNFLNKEYRLLVKSGEHYKLLYLSFPLPGSMKVVAELQEEMVTPIAPFPEIYDITGCWVNKVTGDWTIGFFENFAIYQCRFWDYESVQAQKGQMTVLLKSGKDRMTVQMKRDSDTSCSLEFGKEKPQSYFLCNSQYLPDYPQADNTPFIDNGYHTDSVTIVGYLRNPPSYQHFNVIVPDMITGEEEKYYTDIDSQGRFSIRFPVLNSHQVFIDWGRTFISTSVEPGETYFLYVDFAESKKYFMGDKSRFLNELLAHEGLSERTDYGGQNKSNLDYLHKIQEAIRRKLEYREKILLEHPMLSYKYRYYTGNSIRYNAAYELMQRRFKVNRNKREQLDKEFMTYVDSALYPTPIQPYTLIRDYNSFMRDYVGYLEDITPSYQYVDNIPLKLKEIYYDFEANGLVKLTQKERTALEDFHELQKKIGDLKASKADPSEITTYSEKLKLCAESVKRLVNRDNLLTAYVNEFDIALNIVNRSLEIIDSLPMDANLREILKTKYYYRIWQGSNQNLKDTLIHKLKKDISNSSLLSYVMERQEKHEKTSNKTIEYPESLMPNEPLAGIMNGKQLFNKIIEPYKGKVIYLDVWGTWCGPCKAMMQYAGNVKKLFAGKDVIFLYLCNNSSDTSWKNIIKEYGLTSKNTVHYNLPSQQQKAIEKYLGIRSFPTYMLIDKEGNIVNREAPRPVMEDPLLNAVYKELEK